MEEGHSMEWIQLIGSKFGAVSVTWWEHMKELGSSHFSMNFNNDF